MSSANHHDLYGPEHFENDATGTEALGYAVAVSTSTVNDSSPPASTSISTSSSTSSTSARDPSPPPLNTAPADQPIRRKSIHTKLENAVGKIQLKVGRAVHNRHLESGGEAKIEKAGLEAEVRGFER
ncbi:hypothetical protein SAICODRAFT_29945 [Saitoella complicata NRRL Y-17804]|nr:uncharacterized protein SAICODRAFT_29945 [Saitoella complicata NRRL Y-17804]ODQ53548.1 hypothetical protein SAICODRAFT_29945 [Saitoella complicata NRRL Y-17804]